MATFQLELVTPDRVIFSEPVRSVRAPGIEGSFGVLANHAPLMTALTIGMIRVELDNGDREVIATTGGFMQVDRNRTIILADTAERAEDIDASRAEEAIRRAREMMVEGAEHYDEAAVALQRALNRLKVKQAKNE